MLPSRLPRNTHPQFAITDPIEDRPSSTANGSSAKLPVTSSSPRMTIITRPTGKMSAPTNGWPVVTARREGKAGRGAQQRAGERAADQEIARRQRELGPARFNHRLHDLGRLHVVHLRLLGCST